MHEKHEWSVEHRPATATQATISKAASPAGSHVCKSITATIACVGTATGVEVVVLRDGATGAGTVLWSGLVSAPINSSNIITIGGLNIHGTKNTAMTLEFVAAGATSSFESVAMTGYTTYSPANG